MSETVVAFGPAEPDGAPGGRFAGRLRELGADRRLAPLVAGLGAVAAFASLVSEWQVTTVDGLDLGDDEVGAARMLPADLLDLGALGAAYVMGLLLLTIAVLLALFGPAAGRGYARLAGSGAGGVLGALLLALVPMLDDQSRLVSRFYTAQLQAEKLEVAYGRGLWCALAAVAAALIALRLAGRESGPAGTPRWRHREPAEPVSGAPLDLSITPTAPFASHTADLDRPHRSG
ncbi:hypothetical protein [Actinoplanes teichomyceticus]|nr:hypothetical protein [Actinoplanes teichomyceticus]